MWYRDYRCKNWTMFQDYENNIQYGIDESKNWYSGEIVNKKTNSEYLASNEEVEKALRKEAKRRGFVEGTKFLGCEGDQKNQELTIDKIKFHTPETGADWGLYCGNSWIFVRGDWGTVVESKYGLDLAIDNLLIWKNLGFGQGVITEKDFNGTLTWSEDRVVYKDKSQILQEYSLKTYFYHKSEEHGANFYELVKEIPTKVDSIWKTFVIYKQLGSGLEFSREKEEFYNKFKQVYV